MPAVLVAQHLHTGADVPRLAVSQTARLHNRLDVFHRGIRQCRHIWIFLKQSLDYHIDTRIGTLRRQTDTDQQLPRLIVVQRTTRIRIFFFQAVNYL